MRKFGLGFAVALATTTGTVLSDDLSNAAAGLCEKVQSCVMAQINQEDLTPELRQMMEPMVNNMCSQMQTRVQDVQNSHPLHKPAVACMRSMEALSCEDMRDTSRLQTPECEDYEKQAREYAAAAS